MNCKPGDLAYIVHEGQYCGHLVTVLYGVTGDHKLPDGVPGYLPSHLSHAWVCEKACGKFSAPMHSGAWRETRYAAIRDAFIRPIRDQDGMDETLEWAGKPQEQPCNAL